jgi:hypothetical protein
MYILKNYLKDFGLGNEANGILKENYKIVAILDLEYSKNRKFKCGNSYSNHFL